MSDFLFEIGLEEVPARMIASAEAELKRRVIELLERERLVAVGSDATSFSVSLDKHWTTRLVAAAGVPVPEQCVIASAAEARTAVLPVGFPLFVKPRWEGTAKGIAPT